MAGAQRDGGVEAAFDLLLGEIDKEISCCKDEGKSAFDAGDSERIEDARAQLLAVENVKQQAIALYQRWQALRAGAARRRRERVRVPAGDTRSEPAIEQEMSKRQARLRRGERTPQASFYQPILEALEERGGAGHSKEILDRVEEKMRHQLKSVDYKSLPSNELIIRWENSAQWARYTLTKQGLLRRDSPRGVWQISDAGRAWLRRQAAP